MPRQEPEDRLAMVEAAPARRSPEKAWLASLTLVVAMVAVGAPAGYGWAMYFEKWRSVHQWRVAAAGRERQNGSREEVGRAWEEGDAEGGSGIEGEREVEEEEKRAEEEEELVEEVEVVEEEEEEEKEEDGEEEEEEEKEEEMMGMAREEEAEEAGEEAGATGEEVVKHQKDHGREDPVEEHGDARLSDATRGAAETDGEDHGAMEDGGTLTKDEEELEDPLAATGEDLDEDDLQELMADLWAEQDALEDHFGEEDDAAAAEAAQAGNGTHGTGSRRRSRRGDPLGSKDRKRATRPNAGLGRQAPGAPGRRKRSRKSAANATAADATPGDAGAGDFGDSFEEGYEQHAAPAEETMTSASSDLGSAKATLGARGGRQDLEDLVAAEQQRLEAERRAEAEASAAKEPPVEDELLKAAADDGETAPDAPMPSKLTPFQKVAWRAASLASRGFWKLRRVVLRRFQPDVRRVLRTLRCGRREDHYCVLGIGPNPLQAAVGWHPRPSPKTVKAGHRRAALRLHPDKNKHPKAKVAFDLAQRAYETLKDSEKHAAWRLQRSDQRARRRHQQTAIVTETMRSTWQLLESLARGDLTLIIVVLILVV